MNVIKGNITQATPPEAPTGQYAIRYQNITITDAMGTTYQGRIGSKQGYGIGAYIEVTAEKKENKQGSYLYFRKYNPQFAQPAQQSTQQSTQSSQGYQTSQAAPQSTEPAGPDLAAKENRIVRENTLNRATELFIASHATFDWPLTKLARLEIMEIAETFRDYVYNGLGGQPNPYYEENTQPPDDEIPY